MGSRHSLYKHKTLDFRALLTGKDFYYARFRLYIYLTQVLQSSHQGILGILTYLILRNAPAEVISLALNMKRRYCSASFSISSSSSSSPRRSKRSIKSKHSHRKARHRSPSSSSSVTSKDWAVSIDLRSHLSSSAI